MPEWNSVHIADFNIVFKNESILNPLNLFFCFALSANFKTQVIDLKIRN